MNNKRIVVNAVIIASFILVLVLAFIGYYLRQQSKTVQKKTTQSAPKNVPQLPSWYGKLPIETAGYFVYFAPDENRFKGIIYAQAADSDSIRGQITARLREMGIATERYVFDLEVRPTRTLQNRAVTLLRQSEKNLSASEGLALKALRLRLPFISTEFDMAYSESLKHYFVSVKTSGGYDALKSFLGENGALDLYLNGSDIFVVSTNPLKQIEREAEEDIQNNFESHGGGANVQGVSTATDSSDAGSTTFIKLMQLLFGLGGTEGALNIGTEGDGSSGIQSGPITPGLPQNFVDEPNAAGYYKMPDPQFGEYHIYACHPRRYGKKELISVLYTVALQWKAAYDDSVLRIGDLNAAGHKSHKWGVAVDINTTNGSGANMTSKNYDQARTIALGKMFVNTNLIKNIWFNDPTVNSAVIAYARQNNLSLAQMKPIEGHEDHFHVDIIGDRGPESTPGC